MAYLSSELEEPALSNGRGPTVRGKTARPGSAKKALPAQRAPKKVAPAAVKPGFDINQLTPRQRTIGLVLGTLLLGFVVYANSLPNGFVDFDDPENVLENTTIKAFSAANIGHWFTEPLQYMYTPLVSMSYAIDYRLGELSPGMYHTTNLLLHLANVVLVFAFVRSLIRRDFVAHFAAVAFAIHPMNVDTVSWVSTRSTLLATLFSFAALLFYLRYVDSSRWRDLIIACGLFLAATMSKSSAVVLPVVLFGIDYLRARPWSWRLLWEKIPFFATALAMGLVALSFRVDTVNPHGYTIVDRAIVVCSALLAYLVKLVAPVGISFAYAYPTKSGSFLPWYVYLAPLVLAALVWGLWRLRDHRRIVLFGLAFFVVNILLSQTVLLIDNFQANRYAYLPYVGLFMILGSVLEPWLRRGWSAMRPRAIWTAALVAVVLALSTLTVIRNAAWRDTITIMSDSIAKEPDVAFVYNSRGIARYRAGDYAGATADLEKAVQLDPSFVLALYYRGIIRGLQGNHTGALEDFNVVVGTYGTWAPGYVERAKTQAALGNNDAALADFDQAITFDPGSADAYFQRGKVRLVRGMNAEAAADFDAAIALFPDYADAYQQRGHAKFNLGDKKGACDDWSYASTLGQVDASSSLTTYCST